MKFRIESSIALLFALAIAQAPVHAESALSEGIANFNAKRYHAAAECFEKAVAKDPSNPVIHLYLGKTFEALKERDPARDCYNNCFKLSPFGAEGRQARQRLLDLAGKAALRDHPPPLDHPKFVAQSVAQINNQTNDTVARTMISSEAYRNQRLRSGEEAIRQLGLETSRLNRRYRPSDYELEISNMNNIRSSFHRNDAMAQSMRYRAAAAHKAAEAQLSATNLKRLMAEAPRVGQPHLRSLGTSLYVRNYQVDDDYEVAPADPPLELRAVAKKLLASSTGSQNRPRRSRSSK